MGGACWVGCWSSGRLRCQGKAVARTSFHFQGRKEGIGRHGLIRTVTLENRCRTRAIMGVLGSGVSRGGHGHGPGHGPGQGWMVRNTSSDASTCNLAYSDGIY